MEFDLKNLKPVDSPEKLASILSAVSKLTPDDDVMNQAFNMLDELSSHTQIDEIDASPDGVFFVNDNKDKFEAVATIYVQLNYGSSRDGASMSDAYPAIVRGHFDGSKVVVDGVDVDTSSFYE